MNEHDELRDRAARLAYEIEAQNYGGYDWETAKAGVGDGVDRIEFGVPADELDMAYVIADGIIAMVEQDVARRLLSEDAVEAGAAAHDVWFIDDVWTVMECRKASGQVLQAALTAIGIAVEEEP